MARDLNEIITDIGIGPYQFMQLILVGGIMLTDGAEILLASSLLTALQEVWHLTGLQKGMMMTIVFVGVFVGGLIGGTIADVYGRRKAILLSYVGLVIFGASIALAQGPMSMLILRFLFGICYGAGVAPSMVMLVETAPSIWRAHIMNISSIGFMFGEVYVSVLLIIFMPDLIDPLGENWRLVTLLAVVPGFVFCCLCFVLLQESPHYLLQQGKREEALKAVQYIAVMNHKAGKIEGLNELQLPVAGEATALIESSAAGSASLTTPDGSQRSTAGSTEPANQPGVFAKVQESIVVLSSREYRGIVIGGAYLCFLGNFLFYGLTYALPQVFQRLHHGLAPAYQVLVVSICDLPGVILVFFLIYAKSISHRDGLMVLAACSAVLSLSLISIEHGAEGLYAGLPSAYLLKYTSAAFFTLSYVYLSEVFPASVRSSAIALCISAGRVGSMSAPLIVEALHVEDFELGMLDHKKLPHAPYLMLTSVLCILAIVFIKMFLHFELKNAPLHGSSSSNSLLQLQAPTACGNAREVLPRATVDAEMPAAAG